jgi:hypothetical protein
LRLQAFPPIHSAHHNNKLLIFVSGKILVAFVVVKISRTTGTAAAEQIHQ